MELFSHFSFDLLADITCIYTMSANSSTLFLLADETRQTDKRRNPAPGAKSASLGVWEVTAGKLRIRMNSAVGVMDQIRARRRTYSLIEKKSDECVDLADWFDATADHPIEPSLRNFGFLDHLRQYLSSVFLIFLALGIVFGIAGLCSFYFGVMLPFGLV